LQEKLKGGTDLVELGKENGYDFSQEDVTAAFFELKDSDEELTGFESQLEAESGGSGSGRAAKWWRRLLCRCVERTDRVCGSGGTIKELTGFPAKWWRRYVCICGGIVCLEVFVLGFVVAVFNAPILEVMGWSRFGIVEVEGGGSRSSLLITLMPIALSLGNFVLFYVVGRELQIIGKREVSRLRRT
jgi:hypothetical protein